MTVPGAPPPLDEDRRRQFRAWSAGLDVAAGAFGGGLLGYLIDRWQGTGPWWMLGIGLAGMVSGFIRFIREALALNRESARGFGALGKAQGSRDAARDAEKGESPPSPGR